MSVIAPKFRLAYFLKGVIDVLFWAIILGYLFYNDLPDLPTFLGAIIITISGIYVLRQKN